MRFGSTLALALVLGTAVSAAALAQTTPWPSSSSPPAQPAQAAPAATPAKPATAAKPAAAKPAARKPAARPAATAAAPAAPALTPEQSGALKFTCSSEIKALCGGAAAGSPEFVRLSARQAGSAFVRLPHLGDGCRGSQCGRSRSGGTCDARRAGSAAAATAARSTAALDVDRGAGHVGRQPAFEALPQAREWKRLLAFDRQHVTAGYADPRRHDAGVAGLGQHGLGLRRRHRDQVAGLVLAEPVRM